MGGNSSIATRRLASAGTNSGGRPQSAPNHRQQRTTGANTVIVNNGNGSAQSDISGGHGHGHGQRNAQQQQRDRRLQINSDNNNNGNDSSSHGGGYHGGHSNIDTDAPGHSQTGDSGLSHSGVGNSSHGSYGHNNNSHHDHTSSLLSSSSDSSIINHTNTNSNGNGNNTNSNTTNTSTTNNNATPDSARRRGGAPRHFVFPPVDPAATAAASAIVERYASMDALIGHHSNPNHLPALLECAVESTGVVPFFSASYFALQCDPTLQLDAPNVALSRQLRMALFNDRARMLQSLDALWEIYTAHWLKQYASVHVGQKAAAVVLGYLQVQPKKRQPTSSSSSSHHSRHGHHDRHGHSQSQQSGTSTSREMSLSSRSPAPGQQIAVTSATGTALSMMMMGNRTSAKSSSVIAGSSTSNGHHHHNYESTIGPSTTAPPGLRIAVPDDDSDSILSNNGSGLGNTSNMSGNGNGHSGVRVIHVEDSPKFKLQPIRKGMTHNNDQL